ncbi:hypothetical protein D3C79_1088740 [compost metagenome]
MTSFAMTFGTVTDPFPASIPSERASNSEMLPTTKFANAERISASRFLVDLAFRVDKAL